MATLPHDAEIRIGDDPRRWLWLAAIALVSVLVWTAVLGLALAPHWPDAWSLAAIKQSRNAKTQSKVPSKVSQPDSIATALSTSSPDPSSRTPHEPGAPLNRRSVAYSSVDTRTLATAREREDVLAGKRPPPFESAPPRVVGEVGAAQVAVDPAPSAAAALPTSVPRERAPAERRSSERPEPVAPPARLVPPSRVDMATRTPPIESARRASANLPRDDERKRDAERSAPAGSRATPSTVSHDATSAQLDDRWQRRELWFRERLQAR